eukprot:gene519-8032_t
MENRTLSMEFASLGASGWVSFAFSSTNSIVNATNQFVIISDGYFNEQTKIYAVSGHGSPIHVKNATTLPGRRSFSLNYDLRGGAKFDVEIERKMVDEESMKYILFASDSIGPNPVANESGYINLPKHDSVYVAPFLEGFSSCLTTDEVYIGLVTVENLYVSAYFVSFFIPIILIIICMWFRNEQPLKSRGMTPFVVLFMSQILVFSQFPSHFFTRQEREEYDCFIDDFYRTPCLIVIATVVFLDHLRIVLVLNLNRNKNFIRKTSSKFFITLLKILKYATSNLANVFIIIGTYFIVGSVDFVFLAAFGFYCHVSRFVQFFWMLYVGLCGLGVFSLLIFDLALSYKSLRAFKFREVFLKDDPFLFRIQLLIGLFCIIILGIFGVLATIAPLILSSIFDLYSLYIMMVAFFIGTILIITIGKTIYDKLFVKQRAIAELTIEEESEFTACLKNPELMKHFKKFADSEWSSENYLIYFDILEYKNKRKSKRDSLALKIFDVYLNGTASTLEVNVNQKECENVKRNIDEAAFEDDLFEKIMNEVESNMKDTFGRFRFTKEYQKFTVQIDIISDQMNNEKE